MGWYQGIYYSSSAPSRYGLGTFRIKARSAAEARKKFQKKFYKVPDRVSLVGRRKTRRNPVFRAL
jgi:hypothetical protein